MFWIVQFKEGDIFVLDHYEKVGQSLSAHVAWLRKQGYEGAEVVLPHDGANLGGPAGLIFSADVTYYPASTTVTPEPGTAVLWLTGIGLMILMRKRVAQLL